MSNTTTISNPATSDQSRLTFTGHGVEANAYIMMYDGNEMVGFAVADAHGDYSVVSDRLDDGPHALTFTAMDVAGNVSPRTPPFYVNITLPADTPPKSQIDAPTDVHLQSGSDTGASATDGVTGDYLPTIEGHAKPGSWVQIVIDGVKGNFAAPVDKDGNWQVRC